MSTYAIKPVYGNGGECRAERFDSHPIFVSYGKSGRQKSFVIHRSAISKLVISADNVQSFIGAVILAYALIALIAWRNPDIGTDVQATTMNSPASVLRFSIPKAGKIFRSTEPFSPVTTGFSINEMNRSESGKKQAAR
jgi:hypothetical protein